MKDEHYNLKFYFVSGYFFLVILFVFLVTFCPIPNKNERFVDISLGLLLGSLGTFGSLLFPTLVNGKPKTTSTTDPDTGATVIDNPEQVTVK